MTAARVVPPKSRAESTRQHAIDVAEAMVAEGGLTALNMRGLAEALDIGTATLYRLFGAKEDVLAALADRKFAEVEMPKRGELGWADEVRIIFGGLRRVLLEHPELVEIAARQHVNGSAGYLAAETCLDALHLAGLDQEDAANAFGVLSSFTFGFVQQELHAAHRTAQLADRLVAISALPAAEYPLLRASAATFLNRDSEVYFAKGLDLIIAGVTKTTECPGG